MNLHCVPQHWNELIPAYFLLVKPEILSLSFTKVLVSPVQFPIVGLSEILLTNAPSNSLTPASTLQANVRRL